MTAVHPDGLIMLRRCLVHLRPFRLFILGIGFFTLCFLMTSLGGQFSARRLGDSPFTVRTEVMGALESRGVLRKMSDLLELMVKRMDALARLENGSELRRAGDGRLSAHRLPPTAGLMERLQAIAQNVSDIAVKVDQILRTSLLQAKGLEGRRDQCEVPNDPKFPDCSGKVEWMRARWTSDPCYAFFGVDGTECSFLIYLSEVEWFCPPMPWRNRSAGARPSPQPLPKVQATFRSNLSVLLDLMGSGKESLTFMKNRAKRLAAQWARAAQRLERKLTDPWPSQKQILVHIGFLTEESGDVFSPRVLKGGPLGEMVQWADILAALFVLGHGLKVTVSLKELQSNLGVPPGRGNCPLTAPLPFDLIYTDYHGLQQMKQQMGLSFKKYRCRVRVIDTFGTEPAYNHEEYATLHGYRTNWGYWNLNPKQFMTMFPHTPDNSFMGFVSEELNATEKRLIKDNKSRNMAVVYGKEANIWKLQGKEKFLGILNKYMEIHGTVYYETQRPPEVPAFVKNHGLLPQQEFQQLLRKAKLFIGFGFPYEGPAPLEAIANGCVFLQSRFRPPHSSLNHEFFRGKPTSREVFSQHPYAENFIGKPHVWTVDYNNSQEFEAAIKAIMRMQVDPYLPYEYTCEGMLERIHAYLRHQDFCEATGAPLPAAPALARPPPGPFALVANATHLEWPPNASGLDVPAWPPARCLQGWLSGPGQACTDLCLQHGLMCEPAFFRFLNTREAFLQLNVDCASTESEMNHLYPAFAAPSAAPEPGHECFLQQEPLLFSCAGASPKYHRLCPCRDFRRGQVALCRDCL
ncbi:alpha-1,6-mannosylglycoprotein 6-beta-N-acetylglucosaminyltransferase B isoform X1 [Ornithorhynchus anatinus]|nr:alpha-1,6-mannosylglycoprotein 6-beta-N-acetylglucosaminyltransferase B isoform X1 [Ornithorhynchus anatinus]